ncbi:hypothetical protein E2562_004425 [Oryza meyeriana var. granulata]|uniref:Uncharacterized protein n=1 Tax=Oryza meyeriana var. granulata TaxID=110450 RepID=A0A6G1CZ39_9ORYZ|nr:hypothetical protein E2562_004425 [Oryza meyeriana var. granulata]
MVLEVWSCSGRRRHEGRSQGYSSSRQRATKRAQKKTAQRKTIDADEEIDDYADEESDEDEDYVEDAESEDEDKNDDNDDDEVEDTDDGDNEGNEDANGSKVGDEDEGEDGLKREDDDDTEDGVGGKGDDGNAGKDRDGDSDEKLAESEKNKDGGKNVIPGSQLEEENRGDNGDDTNKGEVPDAKIAEDHVQANKEEGHLEGETKEGSKEQQEGQPLAPAQSTPNQEEEAVGDYLFLARQATPSIHEDVPTFNLGFDSTQETLEEVTITSEDYGSFTIEDYEWVGREADEAIALKALKDFERVQREADEAIAKKVSEDTVPIPHEYNKRVVKPGKFQRSPFIDYENKKQFTVSRHINEIYNEVCRNRLRSSSTKKSVKIMEYGSFYVELKDLTDSITPLGLLSNNVAEMAIQVISADNKDKLKIIVSARVGVYLSNNQLNRNDIKSLFSKSDDCLDHKELEGLRFFHVEVPRAMG